MTIWNNVRPCAYMTSSPNDATSISIKRRFKLLDQFRPMTMVARTTPGTHNPRISAQTVTHRLREIGERPPYTMYVLYAAFLFWPSIYHKLPLTAVIHL